MNDVGKVEIDPVVFHFGAVRFLIAGDDLYGTRQPPPNPSQQPIYVMYAHSLELALKAYLRHVGVSTATLVKTFGHNIGRLYDEANARGLDPLPEHARHFEAVAQLTTESNVDQSLRYWTPGMTQAPRIEWLRTVAHLLVSHVGARLGAGRPPGTTTWHGRRASEMFGPEHYNLPELPAPPLLTDGPARRTVVLDSPGQDEGEGR
jgi:hypothetical protein